MASNASDVSWEVIFDNMPKVISQMAPKADAIVAKAALDIEAGAKVRAPVDTGTLRASIRAERKGQAHWEVVVGVSYGIYPEYGTRYMAARPYLRPAVAAVAVSFRQAMRKVARP